MKKYKHKKKQNLSYMKSFRHRKTGEIATYNDGILKSSGFCVEIGVEPSSKFWEEIIQKDYEIMALKCVRNSQPYIRHENGLFAFATDKGYCAEVNAMTYGWDIIHSVKRILDGEIFTVGDKMTYKNQVTLWGEGDGKYCTIEKFSVKDNKIYVNEHHLGGKESISEWVKYKPLFTTEDGKDVYEGDIIYMLFTAPNGFGAPYKTTAREKYLPLHSYQKTFSTHESAKEYVLMNEKTLSINDLKECLKEQQKYQYYHSTIANAIALIKSRENEK